MDVYVIVNPGSEEQEVIGVTSNEDVAKRWQRNGAWVSKHDLNQIEEIPEGYFFFDVEVFSNPDIRPLVYQTLDNLSYRGEHLVYSDRTHFYAVLARDSEEAVRKAQAILGD